jgi:ABC-2 type transport system permease protein
VARKELADHLRSVRFGVLVVLITLAAVGTVLAAAGTLREAMGEGQAVPAFLRLYTVGGERLPSFVGLITFVLPLLGIAFGFDAVNAEHSQRTLPRLLAQPLYRDDVIIGKFVAGLVVVAVALAALVLLTGGVGIVSLGIAPSGADAARLVAWWAVSVVYVGVWLALAILCSVVVRRPATSALIPLAVWLVLSLFGALIAGLVADAIAPREAGPTAAIENAEMQQTVSRVAPTTLYGEASSALLDPRIRTLGVVLPQQTDRALPSSLPLDQSLLLVWPHLVVLAGLVVALFAVAAVVFLRQEVRA